MDVLKELLEAGKALGLENKDLVDWIEAQQKKFGDQEKLKAKLEKERLENEVKLEIEKEVALSNLKIDNELELINEKSKLNVSLDDSQLSLQKPVVQTPAPKLPSFDEKVDEFDSYLLRFKRFAKQQEWPTKQWAGYLCNCLKGSALEVYSRLSPEDAQDYTKLKEALFQKFELTEEGFRNKFRRGNKANDETYPQYVARMEHFLKRWIDLANIDETFESLFDFILRDQILCKLPDQIQIFIRERKPSSSKEIAQLANIYAEAHPKEAKNFSQTSSSTRQCFICGKSGHVARDCRQSNNKFANNVSIISCNFCHKRGHTEGQCYQRLFCRNCQRKGHSSKDCRQQSNMTNVSAGISCVGDEDFLMTQSGKKVELISAFVKDRDPLERFQDFPSVIGRVNGKTAVIIRDTGCNTVLVNKRFVNPKNYTGKIGIFRVATLEARKAPYAKISIDSDFFTGEVTALAVEHLLGDVLLGNVGKHCKTPEHVAQITTRSKSNMAKNDKEIRSEETKKSPHFNFRNIDLTDLQRKDNSLEKLWSIVDNATPGKARFFIKKDILFREHKGINDGITTQIVVPQQLRDKVMSLAHESHFGCHMGTTKTTERVTQNFYWPGIFGDIKRFVRSCDTCQRNSPKGRVKPVALELMPIVNTPFHRVAIDLVGPIHPPSRNGHKYILTLVDMATRYPEAQPLRNIEASTVADALMDIFSRVGVPKEILSDRGTQFTSNLMKELCNIVGISQLFTTPYHPAANGLVERFNGTLKTLLKKVCEDKPTKWDKYINSILFAYRDTPQSSLGFTPFELLYGRDVRGPLSILRDILENKPDDATQTEYDYVISLREKLETVCNLAHQELAKAQIKYKHYYDQRTTKRSLKQGDKVLLLLPTDSNKLLVHWKGPFTVLERTNRVDYIIEVNGKRKKFHINMLKQYYERKEQKTDAENLVQLVKCVEDNDSNQCTRPDIPDITLNSTESIEDITISENLTNTQKNDLLDVLKPFNHLLTDKPGLTNIEECSIQLKDHIMTPIRSKPYPLPPSVQDEINTEVDRMVEMDVIEPTTSEYLSPVVLVKKKDGSNRFCVDFRRLNDASVFDTEPIPDSQSIILQMQNAKYLTHLDLSKGYWQVPMRSDSKKYTAFSTGGHTMQFKRMPFGLVGAPAVFSRLMRKVLKGIKNVTNYLDDVVIYSKTWDEHLKTIKEFFERLCEVNLTVRPSKCVFGSNSIKFLGFEIGKGEKKMDDVKIEGILNTQKPVSIKTLQAFLGLTNFYRSFIDNYASIVSPLTDLLRKGKTIHDWGHDQDISFQLLKDKLTERPILKLPEFEKPFVIRTDASDSGIGCVLLQKDEKDTLHPVAYCSRTLSNAERKYSTVEKEALAIVWSLQKLEFYTYGKHFTLQTDNRALTFIKSTAIKNGRVFRWGLLLQEYSFNIEHLKSKECFGADFISRSTV